MLRRDLWNVLALPFFAAAVIGFVAPTYAQEKPAEKPAEKKPEKAQEKKDEAKKETKEEVKKTTEKAETGAKDICETAMASKDCSTLCELLKAADLVDTLKGAGPFTVFAPTNAAFEKLGKDKLDALKKDKAKLQAVLKYHVASGSMMAADVTKAKTIKTLNGAELTVTGKDKDWMVSDCKITATDTKCKNGVIHMIDTVAMPPEKKNN